MKIRKYLVKDAQEAIRLIKSDLGPDALIISSRKVYGRGILGLFQRQLEVTAAVDEPKAEANREPETAREVKAGRELERKTANPFKNIQQELSEVKKMLNRVIQGQAEQTPEDTLLCRWRDYLMEMDISRDVAEELLGALKDALDCNCSDPGLDENVESALSNKIVELLQPIYGGSGCSRVMSFIGPTGVGKTTTLAKLAARFKIFDRKKIAMITIDTYRIGAVEQLKTYGEILDVPVDVVITPPEMEEVLKKHQDKDLILIDTAGRAPSDQEKVLELKEFLERVGPHDVYLVLSSNTRMKDIFRCLEHFKKLRYNRFIFTKLDETDAYGPLLSVMYGQAIPVSYITHGQNVPDDIQKMCPQKMASLLFGGVGQQ